MIAILDWGIGGLGLYRALVDRTPDVSILYFSDAGAVPYGRLAPETLHQRVVQVIRFLQREGAERVVVACNAASTVLPRLSEKEREDLPEVDGIIAPGIRCGLESGAKRIGVIGGERTIRSGIYRRAFMEADMIVRQRIAQPLSGMIEAGIWTGEEFASRLQKIVHPLATCDTLLLACTHYPAAIDQFSKALPDVHLLDPVDTLLEELLPLPSTSSSTSSRFFTTGDPEQMIESGALAFGVEIGEVEGISNTVIRMMG